MRYPAREVRMGPAVWNKDITQQAQIIIQAVLPQYQWTNVFIRAHRFEDKSWIALEFATEAQDIWFVDAFTTARVPPYDTLTVSRSPN
jgi:hypothetical protein